jgi:OmpA-OmpF porin, OOP family
MRCNPLRWLWGLLPLGLLCGAALFFERGRVEADLRQRTDLAMSNAGLNWATTGFDGRDVTITGRALEEGDPEKAARVARDVWGVRTANSQVELIERAEAYLWYATRTGNRVRLRGMVPNDNTRAAILNVAKTTFAGSQVDDEMQLKRGVPNPDTWLSGVTFGMAQLAGLKGGESRLDGLGLSVTGDANSPASYRAIKTALQSNLPRGVRLGNDRVTAPTVSPFTWAARHGAGQIVLSGYVSGDKTREDIVTAARSALPRANVVDRMEVAEGAPAGWAGVAIAALKELGRLEDGNAETRDVQLTIAGMAGDEATADAARRNMRSALPQGYRLTDQIQHRAPVVAVTPVAPARGPGPYVTTAAITAAGVVLTGFAPSEALRDAIAQQARLRFPGRAIDNRLEIAPGAPDGWQRCVDGGLLGIARLGNGRLQMNDRRLDVAGTTDDEDLAEAVPADVRAAVRGDCDANVRIDIQAEAAPELVWRAAYSGNDVVLEGDVPSAAVRSQLLQAAARHFRGVSVVDRMRVVETRTRKWPRVADTGLKMLADLRRGEVRLNRQEFVIIGEAADQQIAGSVRERVARDLQKGYTGRDQVTVALAGPGPRPPVQPPVQPIAVPPKVDNAQQCQDGLRSAAREGLIRFARASADIERDSFPTLDKLAGVARACPKVVIEIEGHTDAEGTSERKQKLSDRRARSVVDYLNRAGVDGGKMVAVGYADTRPLAPNDTADNRAKNRRIEFTVKTN